jgi:class 3 adenylate cyclase/CheY-like chemotaxis protein
VAEDPFLQIGPEHVARADDYRRRKETSVLSIVFGDIAGATRLLEHLGEVKYDALRQQHNAIVESVIEREDAGCLVQVMGDGFLAVFSEPSTAVERCLILQKETLDFSLRIGVDLGQVVQRKSEGIVVEIFGRHVYRAARLVSRAQPGQIFVSFPVYDCAVGWLRHKDVEWIHHPPAELKGFSLPISVHEPCQFLPSMESQHWKNVESRRLSVAPDPLHQQAEKIRTLLRERDLPRWRKLSPAAVERAQDARRILWVDDFPENNELIKDRLVDAGCAVEVVRTTKEATERLLAKNYALVITDMRRAESTTAGLELLAWMRSEALARPTILYTSPRSVAEHAESAKKLGALFCTAGAVSLLDSSYEALAAS